MRLHVAQLRSCPSRKHIPILYDGAKIVLECSDDHCTMATESGIVVGR
jgi:hypothetical protein